MLIHHQNELLTTQEQRNLRHNPFYSKFSLGIPWRYPGKVDDLYQCKYNACSGKHEKEEDLINKKCNFNNAIKISREWCKGNDIDSIANVLGIPKSIVSGIYYRASDIAENVIRSNLADWRIGGPGVVVIIDTYPEGCANTNLIRMGRPILCISEVKSVPQKYWLEALNSYDEEDPQQLQSIKRYILRTVQSIILPGSILITPYVSTLCSLRDFQCLKPLYPTIVSTRDLARHNNDKQDIFSNMATIWKSILDVCEEAQFYNSMYVQQFIVSHLWRRRYGDRAFEVFLYQLSLMQ